MKTILVFDFDGTLTRRDTLIEFIRYARGTWRLLLWLLLFSPMLVLMKLRLYDNGKAKQRMFTHFFKGMTLDDFNGLCDHFGRLKRDLLRQQGRQLMMAALLQGTQMCVVSASIDNWVIPFFYGGNDDYVEGEEHPIEIIGTKVEVVDGRLTGRFLTPNCYGAEKVRRLKEALPDMAAHRSHYYIKAYGDSRGDREMLRFADEGHLV